jgi:hypothetical protein
MPQKPRPRLAATVRFRIVTYIEKLTEQRQLQWCSGRRGLVLPDISVTPGEPLTMNRKTSSLLRAAFLPLLIISGCATNVAPTLA